MKAQLASHGQTARRQILAEQTLLAKVKSALAAAVTSAERHEIMRRHLRIAVSAALERKP